MNNGSKSRRKGHSYERDLAKKFRDLGYDCTTSRFTSRALDAMGVDLCGVTGFNIQAKNVERLGGLHPILASMPTEGINLVFHKRTRQGSVVAMSEEDFFVLLKLLIGAELVSVC